MHSTQLGPGVRSEAEGRAASRGSSRSPLARLRHAAHASTCLRKGDAIAQCRRRRVWLVWLLPLGTPPPPHAFAHDINKLCERAVIQGWLQAVFFLIRNAVFFLIRNMCGSSVDNAHGRVHMTTAGFCEASRLKGRLVSKRASGRPRRHWQASCWAMALPRPGAPRTLAEY